MKRYADEVGGDDVDVPALGSACNILLRAEFAGLGETAIASSTIGPLHKGRT